MVVKGRKKEEDDKRRRGKREGGGANSQKETCALTEKNLHVSKNGILK